MEHSILNFQVTVPLLGTSSSQALFSPQHVDEQFTPPERLGENLDISFSISSATQLIQRIRKKEFAKTEWARLAWLAQTFPENHSSELLAPLYLHDQWRRIGMIPYRHQLETAHKVVEEFGGRALLADEVGLGKTIEAGLILKEYMLRQQVRKVLILCPAALMWQWYQELKDKFLISAGLQRTEYDWERTNILIASLDTAKRSPHAEIIHDIPYDMLIVDEAHKIKNHRTSNYEFVRHIQKKFCLMLTATPIQNDLRELYNLVDLIAPGTFGSRKTFYQTHFVDKREPSEPELLRKRLSRIMIRNRRGPETVELTPRHVQSFKVELSKAERKLYDGLHDAVTSLNEHTETAKQMPLSPLSLITLQREVCSSAYACTVTLHKILDKTTCEKQQLIITNLIDIAENITEHSKVNRALELVEEINDKVIIFTEYRATQQLLIHQLQQNGILALGFDGSLSGSRKEWMKELFRRNAQVLVSTESGGEGLNFQFCCHVMNFDLPWNPMKIEQRIGRVHRLGQTRDVQVYNLAVEETIEEYILYLLYEKIRLFEMTIGELDAIITHSSLGQHNLETALTRIITESKSPEEMRDNLQRLADQIESVKTKWHKQKKPSFDFFV